jgi:hypothetical protein
MGKARGKGSGQMPLSLGAFKIAHRRILYWLYRLDLILIRGYLLALAAQREQGLC